MSLLAGASWARPFPDAVWKISYRRSEARIRAISDLETPRRAWRPSS
jgi:hypothetical protein